MGKAIYFDLEIQDNLVELREKVSVILHGAAEKGQRVYRLLKKAGIKVDAYYDRNAETIRTCDGISVFVMEQIIDLVRQVKGTVYFISCISRSEDSWAVAQQIAEYCNDVDFRFVSYWAITFSLYMHRHSIFDNSPEILEEIDKQNAYISTGTFKHIIDKLDEYIEADDNTLWLLQPGKVGSTSILNQIRNAGIRCIHAHTTSYPKFLLGESYRNIWEEMLTYYANRNVKIVTMVREPVERDYSAFWQAFSEGRLERIRIMPHMKGNLQDLYNVYTDMILDGRNTMEQKLGIATPWTWNEEFMWFEEHFARRLGINIYEFPFDRHRGYEIVSYENFEIFIGKVEKIEEFFPSLKEFIGIENIRLTRDYSSDQKWFSMAYKEFKRRVRIPEKYFCHYYEDNDRFKHFYSDEEIASYRQRWEKQVVR